jgi:phospholipase A1/A2
MQPTQHLNWPRPARFMMILCLVISNSVAIASKSVDIARCAATQNDSERLNCYDAVHKQSIQPASGSLRQLTNRTPETTAAVTSLSTRWELDPESKQGLWIIRPYEPMYILPVSHTGSNNDSPQSPTHPATSVQPLRNTEAEFQLSVKTKAAEDLFGLGADFWFAYTQQSQWQLYSPQHSSPFRETDYMPEMFLLFPMNYTMADFSARFIRFGVLHQSNGLADPLSRSWNRVYTQLGIEHGNFTLLVRPWMRIHEKLSTDDNPDITHYMGHGDVTAVYQMDNSEISILAHYGASTLSTTTTWNFPINGRLKGYVKITTGYGETLIDYNWRQNTIGLGILLVDWQ